MQHTPVPTHFYKFVRRHFKGDSDCKLYVVPNKSIGNNVDLEAFEEPIDDIKALAGINFIDAAI